MFTAHDLALFLSQELQLVLRVPLNKISSVLPSWSLQPINRCSLKASLWASLSREGTEALPPEVPRATLLNHGQSKQQELPGGRKWVLNKFEASEAVAPAQPPGSEYPLPSRSFPQRLSIPCLSPFPSLWPPKCLFFSAWCLEHQKYLLDRLIKTHLLL